MTPIDQPENSGPASCPDSRPLVVTVRRGRRVLLVDLGHAGRGPDGRAAAVIHDLGDKPPAQRWVVRLAAAAREAGLPWLILRGAWGCLTVDTEHLCTADPAAAEAALLMGETVWDTTHPLPPGATWEHRGQRSPHPARAGQPVTIHVTGPGPAPRLLYTTDGSFPEPGAPATRAIRFVPAGMGGTSWRATIPPLPAGTRVRYRILTPQGQGVDEGLPVNERGEPVSHRGPCHAFVVEPDPPPDWARDALIYHVFVDRFARPQGWRDGPLPDAALFDFVGGNLDGVRQRLDWIRRLGCQAIWLSPIYRGTTYHGYHVTDLKDVDPRFGSLETLRALVDEAHAMGIRIVLDFVPNHVAHVHPAFLRAQLDPTAPEYRRFLFTRWPDRYATFLGVRELPKVNNDDPSARSETIAAARFWLEEVGVDGLRLDHANGLSHDAWVEFRQAVKQVRADALLLAEVWDNPATHLPYAGEFDAVFDFAACWAFRDALASRAKPLAELAQDLEALDALYGDLPLLRCAFLDNHDMDRFLTTAGGDRRRLQLAALLLYAWSGPVSLYYGTEIGLGQRRPCLDPVTGWMQFEYAREPMPWEWLGSPNNSATELSRFFAQLGALRRRYSSLARGRRRIALADADLLAFWKEGGGESVLVVVHHGTQSRRLTLERPNGGTVCLLIGPDSGGWFDGSGTPLVVVGSAR